MPTLGTRIEGEWIPGKWEPGTVSDVDYRGCFTIRYDDGYCQKGVELRRLRPITQDAEVSRCSEAPALPSLLHSRGAASTASSNAKEHRATTTCSTTDDAAEKHLAADQEWSATSAMWRRLRGVADLWQEQTDAEEASSVQRRREDVLAAEAEELRQSVDKLIADAVASGDWWKLQAATQIVVGAGFGDDKAAPLREAMCALKVRNESRPGPASGSFAAGGTVDTEEGASSTQQYEAERRYGGCCFGSGDPTWCQDEVQPPWSVLVSNRGESRNLGDALFFSGDADLEADMKAAELLQRRFNLLEEAERLEAEGALERSAAEDLDRHWQVVNIDSPPAAGRATRWGCLMPLQRCV